MVMRYDTDDIINTLKIRLSRKRYTHSLNVALAARELSEIYGCDNEKAYVAGLVHDICKEAPVNEQLEMARAADMGLSAEEELVPALYHAPAGAYYAKAVLNINDEDILNAIRFHTIGRGDMSLLEETLYLADLISAERDYKDVDVMRKLAREDKDKAMLEAVRFQIGDVLAKGSVIPVYSVQAYNRYIKKGK